MRWVTKIIYDSDKKIGKTDLPINTPPAYYHYYYYHYYYYYNYNQCYMMINKFVHDFIKLLKYENLFIKRIIDFSDEKTFRL